MARSAHLENSECFFTVGMFSLIDAFFDQPKEKLLNSLPFDDHINQALLHNEGDLGKVLQSLIHHERGQWSDIDWDYLHSLGIDHHEFEKNYLDGLVWAADIMKSLFD